MKIELSSIHKDDHRTVQIGPLKLRWPLPITFMLHSSDARVFGYSIYGEDCPKIIDWLHTIFTNISNAKYWVRYRIHPAHQYHLIRTGLKPGYHCEDNLILYGAMAMLCRYIESMGSEFEIEKFNRDLRNDPDPNAPDGICSRQADRQDEALTIYRWWKYQKPKDEARQEELMHALYTGPIKFKDSDCGKFREIVTEELKGDRKLLRDELWKLDEKIIDDEQSMLHRLIDIRRSLWT